jgi:hypothetical protein
VAPRRFILYRRSIMQSHVAWGRNNCVRNINVYYRSIKLNISSVAKSYFAINCTYKATPDTSALDVTNKHCFFLLHLL